MNPERSSSDRRCRKNKRIRFSNTCTVCGGKLPEKKRRWGLVWNNGDSGMCKECLDKIRKSVNYYSKLNT
jgi:hypothetical protein